MAENNYDAFIRNRITELRMKKTVSEHKMSLDLGKSGAYIRSITNGTALPSMKELFNIISYFDMTPAEFFAPTEDKISVYSLLCEELRSVPEDDLKKVQLFISWIQK